MSCGISFLLCVVWPCLFFGRNCILFIYRPWKCLAPYLAQNRGFTDIHIFNFTLQLSSACGKNIFVFWKVPAQKQQARAQSAAQWSKSLIRPFSMYQSPVAIIILPELESKELEKVILTCILPFVSTMQVEINLIVFFHCLFVSTLGLKVWKVCFSQLFRSY